MTRSSVQRLETLEFGRAFAALAVVAHHAGQASDAFTTGQYAHFLSVGALGVDFFFVLSGFIMFKAHQDDPRTLAAAKNYLVKRVRQIYVPYLPVALLMVAVYTLIPELSQSEREWGLFTSLTLLPSTLPPALSVAWTLVFEVTFYLFFLLFFLTQFFWWVVGAWAVSILLSVYGGDSGELSAPLNVLLSPFILEFLSGLVAALLYAKVSPSKWAYPWFIGILCVVGAVLTDETNRILFGLGMPFLVSGAALAEIRYNLRLPKLFLFFGSASYAIYLVHNPVQSVTARVLSTLDNWALTFSLSCLFGVFAGALYYRLFERPALRFFHARSRQRVEA